MPAPSSERELKLIVPPGFQLPPLTGAASGVSSVDEEEPLELSAIYFDTPNLRLLRYGISLRYRSGEDSGPVWTVKLPADGDDTLRSEIEFTGDSSHPPFGARDLLAGVLTGSSVAPVAELKTRRRRFLLRDEAGEPIAVLVDDRVSVLNGSAIRDSFREIEIESRGVGLERLQQIAKVVQKAGARLEQRSKVDRALGALHSEQAASGLATVGPDDPAEAAVRPALAAALRRLIRFDPHARLNEAEGVHGMRVGTRRLRSVLRTFAPILVGAKTEPVIQELRWLGGLLGGVRDLDVLLEHLRAAAADQPSLDLVLSSIAERQALSRAALAEALSSERYLGLLCGVETLIADDALTTASPGSSDTALPSQVRRDSRRLQRAAQALLGLLRGGETLITEDDLTTMVPRSCDIVLPSLVKRDWRRLRRAAQALLPESSESDIHRVRILAKRCRYAAETAADYTNPRRSRSLRDFASRLAKIQNILGDHQDAVTARDVLLMTVQEFPGDGSLNLQAGRLIEREEMRARDTRDRFFEAWKRIDKKKKRRWSKA